MTDRLYARRVRSGLYSLGLCVVASSLLGACGEGGDVEVSNFARTRTIKVISTRDDAPIPGVAVEVHALGRWFGPYGPEYEKQVWNLRTDKNGEVRVLQPARSELYVSASFSPAFWTSWNTIKFYEKQRKYFANQDPGFEWRDTYYLTPVADVDSEWVRWAYRVASDRIEGRVHSPSKPMMDLVTYYIPARPHAKTDKDKAALRDFCRYLDSMKAEEAQGWPSLNTEPLREDGRTFMADCTAVPGAEIAEAAK